MSEAKPRRYRRSWKNLLINKDYQLRFTLFMVALTAGLMALLGWWVMHEARKQTDVSIIGVRGRTCPEVPPLDSFGAALGDPGKVDVTDMAEMAVDDAAAVGADEEAPPPGEQAPPPPAPAGTDGAAQPPDGATQDEPRPRPEVTIESTTMMIAPQRLPPGYVERVISHHECRHEKIAHIASIEAGYRRIFWILIAVGVVLLLGLTAYSIKMTHRVAGPLHKITLYFDKLRNGTYDQVYNLRRGDQLIEFYEHFKAAHAGLRAMQERDVELLRWVIAAADAAGLASRSPELAATLDDMRATLARKEESLV